MTNTTKDNTVVIYLTFAQYIKRSMQITFGIWFDDNVRGVYAPLSEGDNSVCKSYRMKSTYVRNSPEVKASAQNIHFGTNTSSLTFTPFAGVIFINDCL